MIKVLFFAQVRELVGTDSLTLDASELATVEAVRQQLAARGDRWALALEEGKLLAAGYPDANLFRTSSGQRRRSGVLPTGNGGLT